MSNLYRLLPSVDVCLQYFRDSLYPHALLCDAINEFLQEQRKKIKANQLNENDLEKQCLEKALKKYVEKALSSPLKRVINASGVVIHTNLGRSVLADEAVQAVTMAASHYCNLEFDLETGERGSRHSLVEKDICKLTGAEAALVVNNNAAAVYLMLSSLCEGGEVIVSRGELVEIGGSFRIPEVMKRSGALLQEVGTTNKTHAKDYLEVINENTKAILKVHTSNYRIIGFHSDVANVELAELAHKNNILVFFDLGSGSLVNFAEYGLRGEPTVAEIISSGVDIVTFSGDKVLGGPQAGIIAGKKEYIEKIKKNQMLRALRCDKLTLSALSATLRLYYDLSLAVQKIPTLHAMTICKNELKQKAQKLARILRLALPKDSIDVCIQENNSRVGGGSFPEDDLPTFVVCLKFKQKKLSAQLIKEKFLHTSPPLVGRVEHECFMFDVRTIREDEFRIIKEMLLSII